MKELIGFEIKKIVRKKSFVLALALFLGLQLFVAAAEGFGNVYIETGPQNSPQDDYEVLESFAERNRIDRNYGKELSGTVFDEALLQKLTDVFAPYMEEENEAYLASDAYRQNARKYEGVLDRIKSYLGAYRAGAGVLLKVPKEADFYQALEERKNAIWDVYDLTEGERAHWEALYERLPQKVTYHYSTAYEELTSMQGVYMTHMMLVFLLAMTMAGVFLMEANQNTDQMILCTKKGRGTVYAAKLIAGTTVTFLTTALFSAVLFVGTVLIYGPEGFDVRFTDALAPWFPSELTLGQLYLILLLALFLASILISLLSMLLSWVTKNGIVSVALLVGGMVAARLIPIPGRLRFLAKMWNTLPINLLKIDAGFTDMRLFHIFGGYLTVWQLALILYVLAIIILIAAGKHLYCRTQISGR